MKQYKLIIIIIITLCYTGFSKVNADIIKTSTGDWLPYIGNTDNPKGYVIEITEKIFKQAGHEVIVIDIPYIRALSAIESGKLDLLSCATQEDISSSKVIFADEDVGICCKSFFTLKENSWKYSGVNSLDKIKVLGLVKGEVYSEIMEFIKKSENSKIYYLHGSDAYIRLIKMLITGRVDVIVDNSPVIFYNSSRLGISDKIKIAGTFDKKHKLKQAFSIKNPMAEKYSKIFSEGLRKLRQSGELNKILAKYGLQDWK